MFSFAKLIVVVEKLLRLCRPLQAELCSIESSLSSLLWNYGIAVIFCVLCTCWHCYSFLWYRPACSNTLVRQIKSVFPSKDGISPSSLRESYSNIPSSFCIISSKSEFLRLTVSSLIEVQQGRSSSCHRCFLTDRALTHCRNKCLRPVPHLLNALWCHRHRW